MVFEKIFMTIFSTSKETGPQIHQMGYETQYFAPYKSSQRISVSNKNLMLIKWEPYKTLSIAVHIDGEVSYYDFDTKKFTSDTFAFQLLGDRVVSMIDEGVDSEDDGAYLVDVILEIPKS